MTRRGHTRDVALVLVLLVTGGVLLPLPSATTDLVVDPTGARGFADADDALALASDGDRIRLGPGLHEGPIVISTEGVALEADVGAVVDAVGGTGVIVRADDVTVRGVRVENGSRGIVVEDARDVRIEGTRTVGVATAVEANGTRGLVLWDTTVTNATGTAVRVRDAEGLTVAGVAVDGAAAGVRLKGIVGAVVDDVTFSRGTNGTALVVAGGSSVAVANVSAGAAGAILEVHDVQGLDVEGAKGIVERAGVTVQRGHDVRLVDVAVDGNGTGLSGLVAEDVTNVTVRAVVTNVSGDAVAVRNVTRLVLEDATFRDVGGGVRIMDAVNVTVARVVVENATGDGIATEAVRGVTILESTLGDVGVGIRVAGSTEGVEVSRNSVQGGRAAGILLENGTFGAVVHNNTLTAGDVGVRFAGGNTTGNALRDNVLTGNVLDVASSDAGTNVVTGGHMDGGCHVSVRGRGRLLVDDVTTEGPLKASGIADLPPDLARVACVTRAAV